MFFLPANFENRSYLFLVCLLLRLLALSIYLFVEFFMEYVLFLKKIDKQFFTRKMRGKHLQPIMTSRTSCVEWKHKVLCLIINVLLYLKSHYSTDALDTFCYQSTTWFLQKRKVTSTKHEKRWTLIIILNPDLEQHGTIIRAYYSSMGTKS